MLTSTKIGSVRTCPNCGATVDALAMQCSECGHMLNGTEVPDVLKQFEEKVNAANMFTRPGVIKRFPVPNSQEALFSLIAYLEPLCDDNNSLNPSITRAYQSKFRECMTRAKIAFPEHPTVLIYKELEKKRNRKKVILIGSLLLALVLMIGSSIYFGTKSSGNHTSDTESATETEDYYEEPIDVETEISDAAPSELPEGWEIMYVMSGKYMYCNAEFPCSDGKFSIDLYQDGLSVSLTSVNARKDDFVTLKIGKVSDSTTVDASGSVIFNFYNNINESDVARIIDAISSGREKAYIEIGDKVYTANLSGKAARNARSAFKWARETPGVMEI